MYVDVVITVVVLLLLVVVITAVVVVKAPVCSGAVIGTLVGEWAAGM